MEKRICKSCGKVFLYRGHKSGDHTKYCSDACYDAEKRKANLRSYYKNAREKQTERFARKSDERRRQWLNNIPAGFEYLGDWVGGNTKASLKCLKHGVVVCRNIDAFRTNATIRCEVCEKEAERARNTYGSMDDWATELDRRKELRLVEHENRKRIVVCDVCGKEFTTYNPQQKRCSPECSRAFVNKDKRLTESNTIDKNITLPRLYRRDEGVCYICGLKCNWEDKVIRDDGVTIVGPIYPSIDHVIPIAKGGQHSWENVKLAHMVCNIKKSDDITDAVADGTKVITSGRTLSKKTFQYDREGKLICTYSSTGEAAKATGFQIKGIQKCARGEKPTYRGYVWKYA